MRATASERPRSTGPPAMMARPAISDAMWWAALPHLSTPAASAIRTGSGSCTAPITGATVTEGRRCSAVVLASRRPSGRSLGDRRQSRRLERLDERPADGGRLRFVLQAAS